MTWTEKQEFTETNCLAHEVKGCNLINDKHINLLHDNQLTMPLLVR